MVELPNFQLPLQGDRPPSGYGDSGHAISFVSATSAFSTGIDQRDVFLGTNRCVVCGIPRPGPLEHCHIIMQSEPETWEDLKGRNWLPDQAKNSPHHDPRNGLLMCANHHSEFDSYAFFIRFFPDTDRFVFINYSGRPHLQPFHGKALPLEIADHHAPYPSIFIIHEMRVRGFHPFQPMAPIIPAGNPWQDWILLDGIFDDTSGSFKREKPQRDGQKGLKDASGRTQFPPATAGTGGASSGGRTVSLNAGVIEQILAATRASASWKACMEEGTRWTGTTEENIQKYVSSNSI